MTENRLSASAVSKQLAEAGHQRSSWVDRDEWKPGLRIEQAQQWSPGFRVEQCGEQVAVYYIGPLGRVDEGAEDRQLAEYALALENLGYLVEAQPRAGVDGCGRARLVVSRRPR